VVVGASVRMEGRVGGSVAILPGGDFFLRPGASVEGSLISLGGGAHVSEHATAGTRFELPANVGLDLRRAGQTYTLVMTPPVVQPRFETTGLFGVGIPTYDRVDGFTPRVGGRVRLTADPLGPQIYATAAYRLHRQEPGGELGFRTPLVGSYSLVAEAARRTETNDRWIRGDITNSLGAFFFQSDARNYYDADLVQVGAIGALPADLQPGRVTAAGRVRLGASRASSVPAGRPWALFGGRDGWRENPAIDPGTIVSALVGSAIGWRGAASTFNADADLEWAPDAADAPGDFAFTQLSLDARWQMPTMWGHSLRLRGRALHPLGSSPPRQRWSILGGSGTLPTLEPGELRGDHLAFLESVYDIPLNFLNVPLIGSPSLVLRHAIGSAWTPTATTTRPPLDQNVGAGLSFRVIRVAVHIDPTDPGRPVFSAAPVVPF
jgi:hypothetical protein